MHAHHHVCPSCRGAGTVSAAAAAVTPAPRRRGLFSSSRRKRSVTTAQASSTGGDDGELKFRRFLSLEAAAVSKTPLSSSFSIPLLSLTHTRTPMKRRNRNDGLNDDNDKRSICVSLHYFAPGRIARRRRIWPLVAHRGAVCSLEGLCRRRGLSSRRGRGARQVPRVRRDGRHALRYVSELETEGKENRAADRFFRKKKKTILSSLCRPPPPLSYLRFRFFLISQKTTQKPLLQVRRHRQVARPQPQAHERHLRVRRVPAVLRPRLARLRRLLRDGFEEREGAASEAGGDGAGGEDEARGGETGGGQGAAEGREGGDGEGGGGGDELGGRKHSLKEKEFFLFSR